MPHAVHRVCNWGEGEYSPSTRFWRPNELTRYVQAADLFKAEVAAHPKSMCKSNM